MAPREPRYLNNLTRCLLELGALQDARASAHEGQLRFRGTPAETLFLVDELLTLGVDPGPRVRELVRRCLELQPRQPECLARRL